MKRRTTVRSGFAAATVVILSSSIASAGQFEAAVSLSIDGNPATLRVTDPQAVSRALPWLTGNTRSLPGSGSNAAADLASGTLRIEAFGATDLVPSASVQEAQFPKASASFFDKVTVTGPGTTVMVTATMDVDGALLVTGKAVNDQGHITIGALAQVGLGAGLVSMSAGREVSVDLPRTPLVDTTYVNPTTMPSFGSATGSSIQLHLEKTVSVPVGQPTDVSAQLATLAGVMDRGYTGQVLFGNTARFSLRVPAGYTLTSASGLLLSQAGGPGLPLVPDGGVGVGGDGGAPIPPAPGQDAGIADAGAAGGAADAGQDTPPGPGNAGMPGGCGAAGGPALVLGLALLIARRRGSSTKRA